MDENNETLRSLAVRALAGAGTSRVKVLDLLSMYDKCGNEDDIVYAVVFELEVLHWLQERIHTESAPRIAGEPDDRNIEQEPGGNSGPGLPSGTDQPLSVPTVDGSPSGAVRKPSHSGLRTDDSLRFGRFRYIFHILSMEMICLFSTMKF